MSPDTLDGKKIEVRFKLLLSNAQRLAQEFGSFDVTEETTLSSNKDVVDNFDPSQLGTLLKVLRKKLSNADTVRSMKKKLTGIRKKDLEKEFNLHVTVPPGPDVMKKILRQTLFTAILSKHTLDTEENDNAQSQEKGIGENNDAPEPHRQRAQRTMTIFS
jgi:hypothetical protein